MVHIIFASLLSVVLAGDLPVEYAGILDNDDACSSLGGRESSCALELSQLRAAVVHRPSRVHEVPEEAKLKVARQAAMQRARGVKSPRLVKSQQIMHTTAQFQDVTHTDVVEEKEESFELKEADKSHEATLIKLKRHTSQNSTSQNSATAQWVLSSTGYLHPAWLESCQRIFLDIGSGNGSNVRTFFEPHNFTTTKLTLMYQQVFKLQEDRQAKDSGDCVLGLEPNPKFRDSLRALAREYKKRGWKVHFYPYAAWSSDGLFPMMPHGHADMDAKRGHLVTDGSEGDDAVTVRAVALDEFINSIPSKVGIEMIVMDIEGAEYETLARLIETNTLCQSVVRSLLIAAHSTGDVTHWGDSSVSHFTEKSFEDIKKRMETQKCSGKVTPAVDLEYLRVPLVGAS